MRKRILSLFCVLALCLTMLPAQVLAIADPASVSEIPYIDAAGLEQFCTSAEAVTDESSVWNSEESTWYVVNSNVTISDRIIVTGDVHLILMDGASLKASAGITVNGDNSLTIYGQSEGTGKLIATAGDAHAGIGGSDGFAGGTIIINGGIINATGGYTAAGIGGGAAGNGGTITINGGSVTATGGFSAAGIGGGWADMFRLNGTTTITINGGTVTAYAGDGGAGIGDGNFYGGEDTEITISGGVITTDGTIGIGGYYGTYLGSFSMGEGGSAVIFAQSITDQSSKSQWNGAFFFGTSGTLYGSEVTLDTDVTIPDGYTLTVKDGEKLTVGAGVTVTNNGSIESYGQLIVNGTIENTPANLRIHLNLSENAQDLRFGEMITLTASGENLPAEGDIVQFFYGNYLLRGTKVVGGSAVLTVEIPSHDESAGVSCGPVEFRAEGGGAVGLLNATVRQNASITQLQVDSVNSGSITMGEVTLANGCDTYAPDVIFTYRSEDGAQQGTSDSPTITGLLPNTTYMISAQIIGNDHYLDSAVSAAISVTTSPAQTTLPADGLDLAYGAVTVEQGDETNSLIVRHNGEVYALDSDRPIPITGTWIGDNDADDRDHVPAPAISVGVGVTAHLVLSNVTIPLSTGGSFIPGSISGISINGGVVDLTLEGNNRIFADVDSVMMYGIYGIKLNNSTLTMDGDGFLNIGTPDGSVEEGISGYSSTINLDGGQVLAYERFSSPVTIQNKTAVTLQVTGTVQGAALSKEGGPVGGWYGVIAGGDDSKLWIPNEDGTYRALLLVNGVIKQFEIVMTNGTPTVTPLSGNASVTLPPEAELPLMADSDGNLCLPGESIVQAGSGPEITVNGDGAAVTPEGEVTLPGGGSATVTDNSGNTTTVTVPEAGGTLVSDEDSVILPGGSTVQTGSGPAITVNDDGATVTPEGVVNLPSSGSVTVEDSSGNTTTVTVSESGGTITPNEDSSVDIPAGSTVQTGSGPAITVTGDGATVTPEGAVKLPSSGSVTVEDSSGNTTTITVPETGGTIIPNENGSVNLPGGSSAIISGPSGESTTIIIPEAGGTFDPSEGTITRYYTVTFDSKGGSSVDSIVVTENSPVTKPADPIREGYTFTGWYQDAACTVAWDFANSLVTANTVLYAGWNQVGGDSSGGTSGGSSGSTSGSVSGSVSGVTGSGSNVSVSASGGAVTASQMESAVKKADEGAAITIKATGSSNISLPASGLESAADNDNSLTLDLRYGEVTLSPEALSSVVNQAGSTVTLTVVPVDTDELNSRQQAAVGDAPVFDLTIRSGSTVISDFDGGLVTVSIPYELPSYQDPAGVVVWFMDDDSNITPCETMYDTRTETVIFTTWHFSKYVIGYEEPTVFTDVSEDAYYADAVLWAVANGVTNGTSATTFSPNTAVSRAQMVTFLWRAHGSPEATSTNPFADVSTSDYYYDAVLWAVANGVTTGTSATTFSPDAPVTRAQAVTFQWRAAGSPVVSGSSFDDVAADAYYVNAVTWAVANGITNGTGGNNFSPDAAVSRAQAVTFLWRELA